MDYICHVKVFMIFLTSLVLTLRCSTLTSLGETAGVHYRFDVLKSEDAEHLSQLINEKQGRNLFVDIDNNMAGPPATILVDCYAYSNSGQLLSSLGSGPVHPTKKVIYWMNMVLFIPSIGTVDCNVTTAAGKSRVLTMYDDNNMELSYLFIRWSIDERGFSIYNSVTNKFDLYQTW